MYTLFLSPICFALQINDVYINILKGCILLIDKNNLEKLILIQQAILLEIKIHSWIFLFLLNLLILVRLLEIILRLRT